MTAQFCNGRFGQGNMTAIDSGAGGLLFNNIQYPYPDKLAAGCCLFFAMSYDATATVTSITDTRNGSWSTTPVRSVTGASTILALFRFPNSAAADPNGTPLQLTVVFNKNISVPPTWFEAFSGIKITTPEDGGSGAASVTTSGSPFTVSCGSFTP